jgi:hypothetical protein
MRAPQSNTSLVASDNNNIRACFNCRETGHFIANCPYAKNKPATSAFSNTVNGPRPALTGANRVPIRNSDNSQQMKQQSFGRARVNHIDAQEAQEAQGVVLGEYLVNSAHSGNSTIRFWSIALVHIIEFCGKTQNTYRAIKNTPINPDAWRRH